VSAEAPAAAPHRDWAGIACSGLCLAHCLAPFLLTLLGGSVTGLAWLGSEDLHVLLLVVVPGVAAWSLVPAYRRHRRRLPFLLAVLGCSLLLLAVLLGGSTEVLLTLAGGVVVVFAHAINLHSVKAISLQEVARYGSIRCVVD